MRKRNFRPLAFKTKRKSGSRTSDLGCPVNLEVRKQNFISLEVLVEQVRKRNFRSLAVNTEQKCGSGTLDLYQSRQNGSAGAELQIFSSQVKLEVRKQNFISLTGPYPTDYHCQCWRITDCYNCHSWWRTKGRPCVAKTYTWHSQCSWQDHYATVGALGNTDLGPILGPPYRVENSPSARRVYPVGSLVPVAFGYDACLMSGTLS